MTKNMLKNDKFNFILALLLAITLWFYVIGVENPPSEITIKGVPIQFANVETLPQKGLVWLSANSGTVDVTISGQHSDTTRVGKEDIEIVADLSETVYGEQTIKLDISLPKNVDVETTSLEQVTVFIDRLVTESKPVKSYFVSASESGKEARTVGLSLQTVNVSGAKTLVDRVTALRAAVDTGDLSAEVKDFTVDLKAVDAAGNGVDKVTLGQNQVIVSAVLLDSKTVPLEVPVRGLDSDDAERAVVIPETVTIKGTAQALAGVEKIKADAINVSGIYKNSSVEINPVLPDGVELADDQQLTAMVTVKALKTVEFTYSAGDVKVEGLGEGANATVKTDSIKIIVTGKEAVINNLTAEDFALVADVSGLAGEEEQITLVCRHETSALKVEIKPSKVKVKIQRPDEESDATEEGDMETNADVQEEA